MVDQPNKVPEERRGSRKLRDERDHKVLRLPGGPESSVQPAVLFKGPAPAALAFYLACREGFNGVKEGEPITLVDGFSVPIYACS